MQDSKACGFKRANPSMRCLVGLGHSLRLTLGVSDRDLIINMLWVNRDSVVFASVIFASDYSGRNSDVQLA